MWLLNRTTSCPNAQRKFPFFTVLSAFLPQVCTTLPVRKKKGMNHSMISYESFILWEFYLVSYVWNDMKWYEVFTHMFIVCDDHTISYVWNKMNLFDMFIGDGVVTFHAYEIVCSTHTMIKCMNASYNFIRMKWYNFYILKHTWIV